MKFKFHEILWWFLHRFHPKHRYHVIKTGLKPGWVDRDFLFEHLMVKLLIDFVEKEDPFNFFDTENSPHSADWKRLRELYVFFKQNDFSQLEYDELTNKLCELVRVRGRMWT